MRQNESLQTAAQINAIRTNHMNKGIDKTQKNSRCRLCEDRYETINHIIRKKQQISTESVWVGNAIHLELCKKFRFDHTIRWYMHNPESILKNETHKLLWDFKIQTDHLILAKRPDHTIINKKRENLQDSGLSCPG